jgi:predicted ester cyclase
MTDGDRVLVWYTQYGTHIGNGFPRTAGLPVTGAEVGWTQVHVLRVKDGKAVEHRAVRDDFAMLEQIKSHQDV